MRKRIASERQANASHVHDGWMNLEDVATVEVTSEAPESPIEGALTLNRGACWRAGKAGPQVIRLIFDNPVALHHIELRFDEPTSERMQEFTLRWSSAHGGEAREIVRQQWNFSPAGSTVEVEEYLVSLEAVSVLELEIEPDVGRGNAVATLTSLRVR
jgi:hypothetical protein